jgi:hypothetical protein
MQATAMKSKRPGASPGPWLVVGGAGTPMATLMGQSYYNISRDGRQVALPAPHLAVLARQALSKAELAGVHAEACAAVGDWPGRWGCLRRRQLHLAIVWTATHYGSGRWLHD